MSPLRGWLHHHRIVNDDGIKTKTSVGACLIVVACSHWLLGMLLVWNETIYYNMRAIKVQNIIYDVYIHIYYLMGVAINERGGPQNGDLYGGDSSELCIATWTKLYIYILWGYETPNNKDLEREVAFCIIPRAVWLLVLCVFSLGSTNRDTFIFSIYIYLCTYVSIWLYILYL